MRNFVPPFGRITPVIIATWSVVAFSLCVYSLCVYLVSARGIYDWLLISGCGAFIVGVLSSHPLPGKLEYTLDRLVDRGSVSTTPEQLDAFKQQLEARVVKYWAPCSGLVVALGMAGAFVIAGRIDKLMLGETVSGYIAGCYIGRMVYYGFIGPVMRRSQIEFRIIPGHLDNAAGLKPIGEFYLRQAMVMGIPAAFLAIWLLLFPLPYFRYNYYYWKGSYEVLLLLAILFEGASFLAPLSWFYREMSKQKRALLREADKLSPGIAELQRAVAESTDTDEMKTLKDRLEGQINRYSMIEQIPVLPIDFKIKQFFTLTNVALFIPIFAERVGLSKPWADFLEKALEKSGDH